jgi:hypothetical protein
MPVRRVVSRILLAAALGATPGLMACGGSGHSQQTHRQGAPGKIEALREAQEKAERDIEAEGRRRARQVEREREATRAEAEREADDHAGGGSAAGTSTAR